MFFLDCLVLKMEALLLVKDTITIVVILLYYIVDSNITITIYSILLYY